MVRPGLTCARSFNNSSDTKVSRLARLESLTPSQQTLSFQPQSLPTSDHLGSLIRFPVLAPPAGDVLFENLQRMERLEPLELLERAKPFLQIDIRSGNQIILSDRQALLGSRVAVIFDRGWVRV